MVGSSVRRTALISAATALMAFGTLAAEPVATFKVDPVHSHVAFRIRHLISKVSGDFKDFAGTITGNPKNPAAAAVTLTIQTASIDTQNAQRDADLKSPNFFDVEKYPEITFKSTKIVAKGGSRYDVTGVFTMHGVTREITLPVTFSGLAKDPWGNERAGFSLTTTLDRKTYGITWNKVLDQGGTLVGDDVEITIDLEAVKQP